MGAEAETTAQNTKETRNADAGGAWLGCRFPPLIFGLMGAHGVTRVYVHVYVCVYVTSVVFMCSPPTLFSSL